jgi:hypothetical protein
MAVLRRVLLRSAAQTEPESRSSDGPRLHTQQRLFFMSRRCFGECRILDCTVDAKWKKNSSVLKFAAGQSGKSVRQKPLGGGYLSGTLAIHFVKAIHTNTSRPIDVDPVSVNIDVFSRDMKVVQL